MLRTLSRFGCISLCNALVAAPVICAMLVPKAMAAETAGEFAAICMTIVDTAPTSNGELHFSLTFDNGRCWGAFAAVQELSRIKSAVDKPPLLGVCAPTDTTRRELVRAFTDYVRSHPESRTEEFSVVAIIALRSQYPCKNYDR